jgi:GT2 family glycosyltransferase
MTPAHDLTVIVVTHNRPELALLTLRTARAASGALDVQWIVVDSGSTDGTPDRIAEALPDVTVIRCANVGFAAANNRGLKVARGRHVLLLNPDAEVVKGSLTDIVARLDANPRIGVASVVQRDESGPLQWSIRRFPTPSLALGEALSAEKWPGIRGWREEDVDEAHYAQAGPVEWVVGAFMIAPAAAIARVGGMDERFFLYSEEIDWCRRFWEAGYEVWHLPEMEIIHRSGSDNTRPDLRAQLSYAKLLFARKHLSPRRAAEVQAALALRHALRAATGIRPSWRARARAEGHAFRVVVGAGEPPFQPPRDGVAAAG